MIARTLIVFAALTGLAFGQVYQDGVLLSGPTGPSTKCYTTVVSQFPNPQMPNYASGIEWYGGEVWCGSAFNSTIIRVKDDGTGTPASFSVPSSGVRGILHDGTWLYVTVWSAKTLYELDPLTGAVSRSWVMPFPTGHPNGIALDPTTGELIISDEEGTVHWLDRTVHPAVSITKSLTLSPSMGSYEPRGLEVIGNSLFAGHQSPPELAHYDLTTGALIAKCASPPGVIYQQGVGSGEDSFQVTLWLTGGGNSSTVADCVQVGHYGPVPGVWTGLGFSLAGTTTPELVGVGDLSGGSMATLDLTNALPGTFCALVVGASALNAPFFGGTLLPFPDFVFAGIPTGPGQVTLTGVLPPTVPSAIPIYAQYWIVDPLGPAGYSASNAVTQTTP